MNAHLNDSWRTMPIWCALLSLSACACTTLPQAQTERPESQREPAPSNPASSGTAESTTEPVEPTRAESVPARKPTGDQFGGSICVIDDIDSDGVREWIASDWWGPGVVQARSGKTGKVLWSLPSIDRDVGWGDFLTLIGDVDKDGTADIAIGCNPTVNARTNVDAVIASGRDGKHLLSLFHREQGMAGVSCLSSISDLDGDGISDLLMSDVGNRGSFREGVVEARSSRDGRQFWMISGEDVGWSSMVTHPESDFDGDGFVDMVAIRWSHTPEQCEVQVRSGMDGRKLWSWSDPRAGVMPRVLSFLPRVGRAPLVAVALGDLDAEASHEVRVMLFDPASNSVLWNELIHELRGDVDLCLFTGSDVNGDGRRDIVLGCRMVNFFSGGVYAFDDTGKRLWVRYGEPESDFGHAITGGCDLDQDGCEDLLIASVCPHNDQNPGHVVALSGKEGKRLYRVGRD